MALGWATETKGRGTVLNRKLKVNSWVAVGEGCPIGYMVHGSDCVDFVFGGASDDFEFGIDAEALRQFVKVATKALHEMDALHVQEQSEGAEPDSGELAIAAGR